MLPSRRISTRAAAALVAAGALAVAVVPATAASAASPKPIKTTGRAGPRVVDTVDPCTRGNTPISSLTEGQADASVRCLINQARAANGVPPLPYAMAGILMAKSARAHALLSVNQRFWTTWQSSHMEPGAAGDYNQQITNRILATGYCRGGSWQTNEVTYTQSDGATPASAVNWWMSDPPHRQTLLDPSLKGAGFSAVRGYAQQDGNTPGPNAETVVVDFGSCNGKPW